MLLGSSFFGCSIFILLMLMLELFVSFFGMCVP